MPNLKARAAALHASPEDAEAQFYDALRDGDLDRLMAVWADDEDVVCVHPGGARVVGPQAVRAAFEAIFASGQLAVHPEHVKAVQAMGCAVHSVLERIDVVTADGPRTGWIVATNVYVKTGQGWRMVAHHASPGAPDELPEIGDAAPSVLH
ncbi:MAG: nuclear transport factor 2 family protein [Burkholderiales bacterium]|jgi:ketosteroid isomerase-like protein|nr:nuclear transport factor 2 family protein [Burkholderiales bacterium]